jgi:arylsulfatase A-like enzyme
MPNPESYASFPGIVGRTRAESTPYWPTPAHAQKGAPNVVLIFMDDLGWSDIGCYGSEIATPHIDALAARGVRFNHYTTHPICSAARAALLTGRNAHAVASGWLTNNDPGYPGYSGVMPLEAPTIAETFRAAGYATAMVGKWHNSPGTTFPDHTWPTQRGFERFYGFLNGQSSYFHPASLMSDNTPVALDAYPEGYYATDDWMEKGLAFIAELRNASATKPFLLYVANNAVHSPLQAKAADIAKYLGVYDAGWDVMRERRFQRQNELGIIPADARLAPREPNVPAWEDVPADRQQLFARHMAVYAAMLDCVDQNVGRLVSFLTEREELENTIIVFTSDNGGTGAGGPNGAINFDRRFAGLAPLAPEVDVARMDWLGSDRSTSLYPAGWGQLSNTPFPYYKTHTGGGGRRVSFVLTWPAGLPDRGVIRDQFAHVTDVMPTLMDLCSVSPLQTSNGRTAQPLDGASFASVLRDSAAPAPRLEQYYECWSNRAYYREGWVAVSIQALGKEIDFDNWTLHCHADDFSECVDLAEECPERLQALVDAFDKAAWNNRVYPLDNRTPQQKFNEVPPHRRPPAKGSRRFWPSEQTVHRSAVMPLIANRSFRITVQLAHRAGDQGVLFAIGDTAGGFVAYVEDGAARLFYNGFGEYQSLPDLSMPVGTERVVFEFEAMGNRKGRGRLYVGERSGDWGELSPTIMVGFQEGLDIGIDRRAPVSWELHRRYGNFRYTGTIQDLVIDSGTFAPDSPFASADGGERQKVV